MIKKETPFLLLIFTPFLLIFYLHFYALIFIIFTPLFLIFPMFFFFPNVSPFYARWAPPQGDRPGRAAPTLRNRWTDEMRLTGRGGEENSWNFYENQFRIPSVIKKRFWFKNKTRFFFKSVKLFSTFYKNKLTRSPIPRGKSALDKGQFSPFSE